MEGLTRALLEGTWHGGRSAVGGLRSGRIGSGEKGDADLGTREDEGGVAGACGSPGWASTGERAAESATNLFALKKGSRRLLVSWALDTVSATSFWRLRAWQEKEIWSGLKSAAEPAA